MISEALSKKIRKQAAAVVAREEAIDALVAALKNLPKDVFLQVVDDRELLVMVRQGPGVAMQIGRFVRRSLFEL